MPLRHWQIASACRFDNIAKKILSDLSAICHVSGGWGDHFSFGGDTFAASARRTGDQIAHLSAPRFPANFCLPRCSKYAYNLFASRVEFLRILHATNGD
jgi:hypothetical protein